MLQRWLLVIAVMAMTINPVSAQKSLQDEAEALASEAAEQIVNALNLIMSSIPQYHAPEILENGDIVIRRKQPGEAPRPAPDKPESDKPETDVQAEDT